MFEDAKKNMQEDTQFKKFVERSRYKKELEQMVPPYISIMNELLILRDNPKMMRFEVKAESSEGVQDVVTQADKYIQKEIIDKVVADTDWDFWGEEEQEHITELDQTKEMTLIVDPIEGTNNFRTRRDGQWGSVITLIDNRSGEPVVGVVAHPTEKTLYLGVKGEGAHKLEYDEYGNIITFNKLSPKEEHQEFTYNNSPHFEEDLRKQVSRFLELGDVEVPGTNNELEISRKKLVIKDNKGGEVVFVDPESGALEAVTHRGTIYFKTSNEMAAVFVILKELGGKVTDAEGKPWYLGLNTLIAARNVKDYDYLKGVFDSTKNEHNLRSTY